MRKNKGNFCSESSVFTDSEEDLDTIQANYSIENITNQQSLLTMPFETKQLSSHREHNKLPSNISPRTYSLYGDRISYPRHRTTIKSPGEVMPHLRDRFSNSVQGRKSVLYNNQSLEKPRLPVSSSKIMGIESLPKKRRVDYSPSVQQGFNIITNENS